jgi:hypothetical protein
MANVDIKISQSVADQINRLILQNGVSTQGTLPQIFDTYISTLYNVNAAYANFSSSTLNNSSLTLTYADGATKIYTGVTGFSSTAASGVTTASGVQFLKDGLISTSEVGTTTLNFNNVMVNGGTALTLTEVGSSTSAGSFAYLLPSNSASYDAIYGNVGIGYSGALKTDAAGNLSGSISKLTETADQFISSLVIEGQFQVLGNVAATAQGQTLASVSGNLTSYQLDYRDGSYQYVTGGGTAISNSQVIDEKLFADESRFAGDDVIRVNLPSVTYNDFLIAAGLGNDTIQVQGGGGRLNVNAGAGNDVITSLSGSHQIDGGAGFDTLVFDATLNSVAITKSGNGFQIKAVNGADTDIVSNVERVQFTDQNIALDINGVGGQAFRVYQAAFNRQPDLAGLGYWINDLDHGLTLTNVAGGFFQSAEFVALYGSSTPTDNVLITKLYQNVLHRQPDQAGFDYWASQLKIGGITQAGVLASFSESPENQVQVLGSIQNGIEYTVWLGFSL